jgi:chromosome segregation ATPase
MTKDDKDICYAKLREAWASHDYFWRRFKENKTERIRQTREEFERKKINARQRIEADLGTNREKLTRAESAAARTRDNIVKLEDDIDNAYNEGFRIRAEGWLAEARERLESIEATVDRYQMWVQQAEERLRSF